MPMMHHCGEYAVYSKSCIISNYTKSAGVLDILSLSILAESTLVILETLKIITVCKLYCQYTLT